MVTAAWDKSFARVTPNKKAIAERGWGPLNYNVLLHPEIQLTKTVLETANAPSTQPGDNVTAALPEDLNLTQGLAGTCLDNAISYRLHEDS